MPGTACSCCMGRPQRAHRGGPRQQILAGTPGLIVPSTGDDTLGGKTWQHPAMPALLGGELLGCLDSFGQERRSQSFTRCTLDPHSGLWVGNSSRGQHPLPRLQLHAEGGGRQAALHDAHVVVLRGRLRLGAARERVGDHERRPGRQRHVLCAERLRRARLSTCQWCSCLIGACHNPL